jgi:hypothetical protein
MSLIFKALQRSRQQSPRADRPESATTVRKRNGLRRNLLFRQSRVLLAGVSIFLVGLCAAQMVQSVSLPTPSHAEGIVPSTHPVADTEKNLNAPASADIPVSFTDTPDPVHQANASDNRFQFFPAATASTDRLSFVPPADVAIRNTGNSVIAVTQPRTGIRIEKGLSRVDAKDAVAASFKRNGNNSGATAPGTGRAAQSSMTGSSSDTGHVTVKPPVSEPDPVYLKQVEQARRHITVTRLANRLNSAVQAGDTDLSTELLKRLAKIKGEDNPYVLKLAAYAHIRQGNLEQARELLAMILADQPDDLDAGLNMAVVDIRAGRHENARQRLGRLLDLYPEEGKISRYLRRLHP